MKCLLGAVLLVIAGQALGQGSTPATVRQYLWSSERPKSEIGEINVFRRFSSERTAAMREFYGEVLGLPVLPEAALGGGQMIRYPLGASEVKLFPVAPSAPSTAGLTEATGVRLLTFFYADQAAVAQRFAAHGLAAPGFAPTKAHAGATAAALVQDPDGEWVELVVVPRASAEDLARFEIGIAVADLAASGAFYGDVMGLAPQPPVRDDLIGAEKHPFKHGDTTINLWSIRRGIAERRADRRLAVHRLERGRDRRRRSRARRPYRSAVVGAGANADAVASRSRRRQQLLRGVRRQRQQPVGSIVLRDADVGTVRSANDVVARLRRGQCEGGLAVGSEAIKIEVRVQTGRARRPCGAEPRSHRQPADKCRAAPMDRHRRGPLQRGVAGSALVLRCQR